MRCCCAGPFAALADVAVPPFSGRVVDQTGTLSSGDIASLTQTLKNFEARKGSQIAVLIVPTTAPETIEQYSIRVAEAWKVGRKKIDDGALLVIAKNDHKLRIEVGYGLEGALTDVTAGRIIDEIITPKFRSGDFAGGISAGVDRIIGVVDGEPLPAPRRRKPAGRGFRFRSIFQPDQSVRHHRRPVFRRRSAQRARPADRFGCDRRPGGAARLVIIGSLIFAVVVGAIASVFTMFSDGITAATPGGRGRGGWSGGGPMAAAAGRAAAAVRATAAGSAWRRRQFRRRRRVGKLVEELAMGIRRIGKHLIEHRWRMRRIFTPKVLAAIEQAIKAGEATHSGQIRFVVEGALDGTALFRDQPARERALDIFSRLRIWDTAHNNGVLIYLLLADRQVEIVADRGIDAKVGAAGWAENLRRHGGRFQGGKFRRRRHQGHRRGVAADGDVFSRSWRGKERTAGQAGGDLVGRSPSFRDGRRSTRPQMRNCASGESRHSGSMPSVAPE